MKDQSELYKLIKDAEANFSFVFSNIITIFHSELIKLLQGETS